MKRVVVFLAVVSALAAPTCIAADSYRAKLLGQIVNVPADSSYTVERGATTFVVFWIILLPMVGSKNRFGLIERCALMGAAKYEPVPIESSQVRRFFR